ncbi:MAG: aldo/keto reductase [Rhodospirillaceae bacterium]|nr:aldo/keto reductase [Rhodospirillaceae bacterium]
MEYRYLGRSGLKVSAVGLGCNNFGMIIDAEKTKAVVDKAIEIGITLFDTADVYGEQGKSEEYLGKALGTRRKQVIVATKFGSPMGKGLELEGGGSRGYIMKAAEASLKRLGTDYIDLYQIHRPDPATPIDETMRALDDLVRQGKVRYIGHSNFAGWQAADAAWVSKAWNLAPFISAQNGYSILNRAIEAELVPACQGHGVGILPFFPLESGLLTGKYKRGEAPPEGTRYAAWSGRGPGVASRFFSDEKFAKAEQLQEIAAKYNHSMLEMAFGWLLAKPYVTSVIAGATRPEQLDQNLAASLFRPSVEELQQIDAVSPPPGGVALQPAQQTQQKR